MRAPLWAALLCGLSLMGCTKPAIHASEAAIASARYKDQAPPSVTLLTVISNSNGSGAHSALLINAAEQIIYDPAGTWYHPRLPERGDVHFGITPQMVDFYVDYHARVTYHVVTQKVNVSPETAALIYRRALAEGRSADAMCANHVSDILAGVPGFEPVRNTLFPKALMAAFDKIPGVEKRVITDEDDNENHGVLMVQAGKTPR
jgi:hypothetical protein